MSLTNYAIHLCDTLGNHLQDGRVDDAISLAYSHEIHAVGTFTLALPYAYRPLVQRDTVVEIQRSIDGITRADAYFTRWMEIYQDGGQYGLTIGGYDANYLLEGRRVIGDAGSSATLKAATLADSLMHEIVDEHISASASDSRRRLPASLFDFGGVTGTGSAQVKEITGGPTLLQVLLEIHNTSVRDGNPIWFDCVPVNFNPLTIAFTTFKGQRGQDRTATGGGQLILSPEKGTLQGARLRLDYSDEITAVHLVGERHEDGGLPTLTQPDATRSTATAWAWRESYARMERINESAKQTDEAESILHAGRPRLRFSGEIVDTKESRYGLHWGLGDMLPASMGRDTFDVYVAAVAATVNQDGERLAGRLEAVP